MSVTVRKMQTLRVEEAATIPRAAMVLCAGKGTRMMPLTADKPKALVSVGGKPMLERTLERCAKAGVQDAVLNMHYAPDAVRDFAKQWRGPPQLHLSDETDVLLDTGGGIEKALPLLGQEPFLVINCDVLWRNGLSNALAHLAHHWDDVQMDVLLMLVRTIGAVGIGDRGDFHFADDGRIAWPKERKVSATAYAGIQMLHPRAFENAPGGVYSVRDIWTRAIDSGRAFGCLHEGLWAHVGTPASIADAEAMLGFERAI
ncbi:MAG: nucleotidyltransferase family protein [Pseudomonadota bacterium]